eukprot:2862954-Prymnesium_polylepis.4
MGGAALFRTENGGRSQRLDIPTLCYIVRARARFTGKRAVVSDGLCCVSGASCPADASGGSL